MRKEKECGMLRFSKKMSRDVLHSQSVHFTTVILKYSIKKNPTYALSIENNKSRLRFGCCCYVMRIILQLNCICYFWYTHCCIHNLKESLANNHIWQFLDQRILTGYYVLLRRLGRQVLSFLHSSWSILYPASAEIMNFLRTEYDLCLFSLPNLCSSILWASWAFSK